MSAPTPSTNATAPPTTPAASPPTPSPPPPSNSTSSPAPLSSPPPPVPTSPPPAAPVPTPPPPSTNSSASPPPPSSSGSTPPPPDSSPPPPSTGGLTPSPPPPSKSSSSPPPPTSNGSSSPPPPSTTGTSSATSSSSTTSSNAVIIGVAVAGVLALLLVIWCFTRLCRRKKKRRDDDDWAYYGQQPPPPPPPHKGGYGDGRYGAHPQTWQNNAPPPANHVVGFSHPPSPPPPIASRPPQPPPAPQIGNSSGFSGASYSGSESILPPPSPGFALGFSKSMFTYEELSIATNGFSPANLLGQGGFGYVHKGILPDGKEVAVKQLKAGSGQGDREFQAEVEIISRVHHRYLVSLVGYCMTGTQRLLVYEFVPNNTLEFHLHGKGRPTMDWPSRLRVALGSAKGLAYLHEDCHPRIIHRDIKAANILLDFNFDAKVADFGLAKLSADNNTHVSTRVMGTFGYLAPEYASSGKLSEKSDVFSFGVMLLELITGRRPVDTTQSYMDDSLVDWARPLLTRAIEEGIYEELVDPKLENFNTKEMAQMVACAAAAVRHSAKRRPKMSQIVRALENDLSLDDLNEGVRPGHSRVYGSSSDYDSSQYNEDMKKFRMMALASKEYGVSGQSVPTSEYGLNASTSSSEGGGPQTREMELGAMRRDVRGTSPGGI